MGRRAGLKILWRSPPCGFESHSGHSSAPGSTCAVRSIRCKICLRGMRKWGMRYFLGFLAVALVGFGGPLNAQDFTEYKYKGETFQLDDSKGCYVAVTYKHLTGYVGVNLRSNATDQNPYAWDIGKGNTTPNGMKSGNSNGRSFKVNLDALCGRLLRDFRTAEAAKMFDHKKYCAELHDGVKNLP